MVAGRRERHCPRRTLSELEAAKARGAPLKAGIAKAMEQEARAAARKAAALLKKKSFTVRDAGEVLDLSHQRVQQLLDAAGR